MAHNVQGFAPCRPPQSNLNSIIKQTAWSDFLIKIQINQSATKSVGKRWCRQSLHETLSCMVKSNLLSKILKSKTRPSSLLFTHLYACACALCGTNSRHPRVKFCHTLFDYQTTCAITTNISNKRASSACATNKKQTT